MVPDVRNIAPSEVAHNLATHESADCEVGNVLPCNEPPEICFGAVRAIWATANVLELKVTCATHGAV